MAKLTRVAIRSVLFLVGAILLLCLVALGTRLILQQQVSASRQHDNPEAIERLFAVELGGVKQWVSIRGTNRNNPVLLYLHGGPGTPMIPLAHEFQTPWEEHFTVVQWDQRGAGKTYSASDRTGSQPALSLELIASDAAELISLLCEELDKEKLVVLGHSWGTMVGMSLVARTTDQIAAFIGTGMVVSVADNERVGYARAIKIARETNNENAIAELEAIAPYPHPLEGTTGRRTTLRRWQREFGFALHAYNDDEFYRLMFSASFTSPDYTTKELKDLWLGSASSYSNRVLAEDIDGYDLRHYGNRLTIPIALFLGRHDWQTPSVIAEEYLSQLEAPYKKLVWFEQSAHTPPYEEREKFALELLHLKKDLMERGFLVP